MPIATPEVYAEMLDRAKAGAFAYPAINVTSSQTLNAALRGFAEAEQRRHRAGLHRRRGVPLRHDGQGHGARRAGARRVRPPRGQGVRRQHRAAHRPLPEGQARRLHAPADRDQRRSAWRAAASRCSSRTCGTARRSSSRRTCRSPQRAARRSAPRRRSSWRSRSASSAARRTASPTRSTRSSTRRPGRAAHRRGARHRREGPLHAGGDVRQRARRLQAGQREAAAVDPQGDPGRGRRRSSAREQAVRPGLPRRLGLAARGDPRDARLRRGEDERRHRHAVRLHPADRRPHVHATTTAC